jgi:tRNA G18 (ribose-2'-O)-methylase SpoU
MAILEGLNDHENLGALFRNAAAFGVAGILLDPTCADPLYRRSVRVSIGHVLHVPFARVQPWPSGLGRLRDAGVVVAALAPRPPDGYQGRRATLTELRAMLSRDTPVAVLLGAEGPGLTHEALALADVVVSIPMAADVDSVNVATAAALAFHALADHGTGGP